MARQWSAESESSDDRGLYRLLLNVAQRDNVALSKAVLNNR
jgi:hypothetical protein